MSLYFTVLNKLIRRLISRRIQQPTSLGSIGEDYAAKWLRRQGFKVLLRQYKCRYGEIDIVARDGDVLVFVEVKTRSSAEFGDPSEAVDENKQLHISRVALHYLRALRNPSIPCRFDIVEVILEPDGPFQCRHTPDAFPLSDPYIY
jgi:putative endonuclease